MIGPVSATPLQLEYEPYNFASLTNKDACFSRLNGTCLSDCSCPADQLKMNDRLHILQTLIYLSPFAILFIQFFFWQLPLMCCEVCWISCGCSQRLERVSEFLREHKVHAEPIDEEAIVEKSIIGCQAQPTQQSVSCEGDAHKSGTGQQNEAQASEGGATPCTSPDLGDTFSDF